MDDAASAMLSEVVTGPAAWPDTPIGEDDWLLPVTDAAVEEIERTADHLARHPVPTLLLDPADFDMPHCRAMMARVREILTEGVRFCVLDRLPIDRIGVEGATRVNWLLNVMVSRPVAQKLDGSVTFDVEDIGKPALPGSGVRPAQTAMAQLPHNDNAYSPLPPDYVSLLCVNPAKEGGVSRVSSFFTVHNRLLADAPEALARLYRPFPHDRQKEFWPGEDPILNVPVFAYGERLTARFSPSQIRAGYALLARDMEPDAAEALEAISDLVRSPSLAIDFTMERGQVQFVNNRQTGHARTAFVDHDDPALKRRMIRLWLRDQGGRAYNG